jgi:hypothetical protein
MSVDIPVPSLHFPRAIPRSKYSTLVKLITEAGGQWIAIAPTFLRGTTQNQKQVSVHCAMNRRGLRVQCTSQHGYIYARLKPVAAVPHA